MRSRRCRRVPEGDRAGQGQPVPLDPKAKLAREQEELYLSLCLQAVQKSAPVEKPAAQNAARPSTKQGQ